MRSKTMPTVDEPELKLVRKAEPVDVPTSLVLKQPSQSAAIALCVQVSGLDDKEVYLSLGIDAGHWSRIMKGDAHFPVNKLNELCDMCGNESPLIWWIHSRGYDPRSLRRIESDLERENRLLRERLAAVESEREVELRLFTKIRSVA